MGSRTHSQALCNPQLPRTAYSSLSFFFSDHRSKRENPAESPELHFSKFSRRLESLSREVFSAIFGESWVFGFVFWIPKPQPLTPSPQAHPKTRHPLVESASCQTFPC